MFLSVIGTGILLLTNSDGTAKDQSQDDLSAQLEQMQAEQAAQAAACPPLEGTEDLPKSAGDPEVLKLSKDITELETKDLKVGTGKEVKAGDCITVNYHGTLADGTVFDSSYEDSKPVRFALSGVIEGWQQGVPGMKVGGVRRLVIPSELAYGEAGSPPTIPENADLVFIVEVLAVQ